jgi:Rod binding domain-containing protein
MMKELMKPMTRSASGIGDDSDQDEGSNGALGEFASEALAQALSQQGGFGIAKGILHSLAPASQAVSVPATLPSTGNQNERVPVNTKPPIDTV